MNFLPKIWLILLFIIFSKVVTAQELITNAEIQNSDPLLYNGKFYTFYPPLASEGNQFFSDRKFINGTIKLRGVVYTNQMINYDIYNQQLILRYEQSTGVNQIIISEAWLETFNINDTAFEIFSSQDSSKKIFQVIGSGSYRILYYWKKNLELDGFHGSTTFVFSKPEKEMSLYSKGGILKYRNNKSFYSLFEPDKNTLVKSYLRNHKLNVKKADDKSMSELISYCNNL